MQIAPEEGALLALLVRLTGRGAHPRGRHVHRLLARRRMALALPPDGRVLCCDVSEEWTAIARRDWTDAGVADRVELRLGPAVETLRRACRRGRRRSTSPSSTPTRPSYATYYEACVPLCGPAA